MYRCIVAPVDGSGFGEHALPLAAALARGSRAPLHLVHVHVPLIAPSGVETVAFRGEWAELTQSEAKRYLAGLADRLARAFSVRVESAVLEGPVAASIAEHATRCGAGVVVMSTHAHLRLRRLWHHGVAEQVARELPVPVLLVHPEPEDAPADLEAAPEPRHVLIPLDGSPYAEAMIPHALDLGAAFGARYTLLQVIRPQVEIGYTLLGQDGHVNHHRLERDRSAALAYLRSIAARLRSEGHEVRTEVVVSEEPADAIVGFARASRNHDPIDLIAMETHPHRPISRILGAHTADRVLHDAPVPVLLFEPTGAAGVPDAREIAPEMPPAV